MKLKPIVLRKSTPTPEDLAAVKRNPIYLVLDRIIDTYNIGSLFRLGDAIAAEKMFLCGDMEYPPASRIHKAAVGTEKWVPWEKIENTSDIVTELKSNGVQIIAVEQSPISISYSNLKPQYPCAIISGNETEGLSKEILELSDIIVELPMYGINNSFNVWGSTAIVAYKVLESLSKQLSNQLTN